MTLFLPYLVLLALLAAQPVGIYFDQLSVLWLTVAFIAIGIFFVARSIGKAEARQFWKASSIPLFLGALPCIWIAIQMMPIGIDSLSHPIWKNTADALNVWIAGRISVDVGATAVALCHYASFLLVFVLTAALTTERRRARMIFHGLAASVSAAVALLLLSKLVSGGSGPTPGVNTSGLGIMAGFGVVLTVAVAVDLLKRSERERGSASSARVRRPLDYLPPCLACALCLIGLLVDASIPSIVIMTCGLGTLGVVLWARSLRFDERVRVAIVTVVLTLCLATVVLRSPLTQENMLLGYAGSGSASAISPTKRMIEDTPWLGSGAGSFIELGSLYRQTSQTPASSSAPTFAAKVYVELGPVVGVISLAIWGLTIFILLRGTIARRRDYLYSATAAATAIVVGLSAFTSNDLAGNFASFAIAVILGIGVSQRANASS